MNLFPDGMPGAMSFYWRQQQALCAIWLFSRNKVFSLITEVTSQKDFTKLDNETYTLTVTADSGYTFYGWMSTEGVLTTDGATSYTYSGKNAATLWPLFIKSDSAMYYIKGASPLIYYGYLDEAIAAAGSSGTVVLYKSGTAYHSDSTQNSFTIPVGVTLLLPYSADDTSIQGSMTSGADYLANGNYAFNASGGQQAPNSNVTYTLTIPDGTTLAVAGGTAATVGNCGRIVVGGKIASGNGSTIYNGATYKEHSNLVVNGTLNLGDYAVLAATGYVMGSGDIIAEGTGAQIYQPYVVMDFPGAAVAALAMREGGISGATQPSGEDEVSPYIYWGVVNIQADLKLKSGNFMYAYATLGDDGNPYHTNAVLVGNSSTSSLLVLDSDATLYNHFETISWSGYSYGLLGRNQIQIEGGASIGSLQLSLNAGWTSVDIDTSSVTVGIGYNMDITLATGDDYYIDKSMMLLPGTELTVAETATLTIGSKASNTIRFAVWDGLIHRGYRQSTSSKGEYQIAAATTRNKNVNYPTNVELDKGGLSEDAEFVIDGKLVIGANAAIGGIIQTNGGGTVEVNPSATTSVKVQSNVLDCQFFNSNYRYMASMSMFDSTAKLNLNGKLTGVTAGVTYVGTANSTLTNDGFTNIYYPGFDSSGNRVAAENLAITYNSAETIKGIWSCKTHAYDDNGVCVRCDETAIAKVNGTYYATLAEAASNAGNGTHVVQMNVGSVEEYTIKNKETVKLDLNGKTVSQINIESGGTLYGFDSASDGYNYDTSELGSVTVTIDGGGTVAPAAMNGTKGYVAVAAGNVYRFHRFAIMPTAYSFYYNPNEHSHLGFKATVRSSSEAIGKIANIGFTAVGSTPANESSGSTTVTHWYKDENNVTSVATLGWTGTKPDENTSWYEQPIYCVLVDLDSGDYETTFQVTAIAAFGEDEKAQITDTAPSVVGLADALAAYVDAENSGNVLDYSEDVADFISKHPISSGS